jgi:hypothetical protein
MRTAGIDELRSSTTVSATTNGVVAGLPYEGHGSHPLCTPSQCTNSALLAVLHFALTALHFACYLQVGGAGHPRCLQSRGTRLMTEPHHHWPNSPRSPSLLLHHTLQVTFKLLTWIGAKAMSVRDDARATPAGSKRSGNAAADISDPLAKAMPADGSVSSTPDSSFSKRNCPQGSHKGSHHCVARGGVLRAGARIHTHTDGAVNRGRVRVCEQASRTRSRWACVRWRHSG